MVDAIEIAFLQLDGGQCADDALGDRSQIVGDTGDVGGKVGLGHDLSMADDHEAILLVSAHDLYQSRKARRIHPLLFRRRNRPRFRWPLYRLRALALHGASRHDAPGEELSSRSQSRKTNQPEVKQSAMHWHPPDRSDHCFGPMVPVTFNLEDLTQPDTSFRVLGLMYITCDQPSSVCAYATNSSFGITNTPSMRQEKFGAE